MKTILPNFAGFYESQFSDIIDREIEMDSDEENLYKNTGVPNYQAGRLAISKGVVSAFNQETGLNLEFIELSSPREYNFTTDKIICKIPDKEWENIKWEVMQNVKDNYLGCHLIMVIDELFTPRSGFIPYYSDNLEDWLHIEEFSEVETMVFLQAWFEMNDFDWDYAEDKPCVYEAADAIWN